MNENLQDALWKLGFGLGGAFVGYTAPRLSGAGILAAFTYGIIKDEPLAYASGIGMLTGPAKLAVIGKDETPVVEEGTTAFVDVDKEAPMTFSKGILRAFHLDKIEAVSKPLGLNGLADIDDSGRDASVFTRRLEEIAQRIGLPMASQPAGSASGDPAFIQGGMGYTEHTISDPSFL